MIIRLDPLDLNGKMARGFAFFKVDLTRKDKNKYVEVTYQNRIHKLSYPPRVLVFDSGGILHQYSFHDTRFSLREQSILTDPIDIGVLDGVRITPAVLINQSTNPFQQNQNNATGIRTEVQDFIEEEKTEGLNHITNRVVGSRNEYNQSKIKQDQADSYQKTTKFEGFTKKKKLKMMEDDEEVITSSQNVNYQQSSKSKV